MVDKHNISSSRELEHPVLGMVDGPPNRWFPRIGSSVTVPAPAALEGRGVQVKRHGGFVGRRIAHLVIPDTVGYVGQTSRKVVALRDGVQLLIVPDLSYLPRQDLEPATVAGMIVNGRFLRWIPAQQEQGVAIVVR